ncbi:hypothetical protein DDZ13_10185 [Coraliomargarita sinensis]|uniref:DUF4838 domain-containing protein n=1 Tax=Coraliomargarita sinensis TaxID=2174842 RepID=A0A317ZH71_9BACT|nr:DUF4838 domain-containing protein [Coraliomargarita sinensis]PXA03657.1 hypothetical protein DDZ13_10185 [Coraliomargarita sinensis]
MSLSHVIRFVFLLSIFIAGSALARTVSWKPERTLGSAQLALDELRGIYLPDEPSERLQAAADDLLAHWPGSLERATGEPTKRALVLVRDTGCSRVRRSLLRGGMQDTGGFTLRRDRTRVYLTAATDEGLANGLYAICRELLGLRWYWAGELGFETVGEPADTFPDRVWREEPAFVQRALHPVNSDFGRRNGLNRVYSFNHNLARIFDADVYEAHPEVFAEIGGERRPPRGSAGTDPQPDFTHPLAVELAAEAARAHFAANPEANSFSLSINDNSLFDEGERTARAVVKGGDFEWEGKKVEGGNVRKCEGGLAGDSGVEAARLEAAQLESRTKSSQESPAVTSEATKDLGEVEYFRGRPNYTDLVFGFMNQVATRVFDPRNDQLRIADSRIPEVSPTTDHCAPSTAAKAPFLTALAYYWTEQSPSFKIHPQVMPVLTSDRAQWHDPAYRAQDKALIDRWANSGAGRIATWDYYFGAPYPYPRQFTQWIGESIAYLHGAGVDVFYSQLPSVWGLDGPKAWLTAELLRDPRQDVGALLDEYYREFFGAAAEPIREFYRIAEQTRNERAGTANWIKFYKDEAGIELFDKAKLQRMRECLDRAEALLAKDSGPYFGKLASTSGASTGIDRFKKRVQVVSEAFAYTESYADYHRSRLALVDEAMARLNRSAAREGASALLDARSEYLRAKQSFDDLKGSLAARPMHGGFKLFNRLAQSDPMPLVRAALAHAGIVPEDSDEEQRSMLQARQAGEARYIRAGVNPGLKHDGVERRNFLGPNLPVVEGWGIEYRASEGLNITAARGQEAAGLRIEHADIVGLTKTYPVLGEKTYLLEIDASWQVSPDNRTRIQLNWKSADGQSLRTDIPLRLPNGDSGGIQKLQFVFQSPVNAYDLKFAIVTNRQYEGDFLEIRQVAFGLLKSD